MNEKATKERTEEILDLANQYFSQIKNSLNNLQEKLSGVESFFAFCLIFQSLLETIRENFDKQFSLFKSRETMPLEFLLDYENIKTAEKCMAAIISNHQSEETP